MAALAVRKLDKLDIFELEKILENCRGAIPRVRRLWQAPNEIPTLPNQILILRLNVCST
jgi:hypothetical protein